METNFCTTWKMYTKCLSMNRISRC